MGLLSPNLNYTVFLEDSAPLHIRHCPKLQHCAISRKTNDANLRIWQKPYFQTQFWAAKRFLWVLPLLARHSSKLWFHTIQRKPNEPNLRKWWKTSFWAIPWCKFGTPKFFSWVLYLYYMLDIVASYHRMQYQGKLMNQTWENGKKTNFESNFGLFGPNLGPLIFFLGFTSNRC